MGTMVYSLIIMGNAGFISSTVGSQQWKTASRTPGASERWLDDPDSTVTVRVTVTGSPKVSENTTV